MKVEGLTILRTRIKEAQNPIVLNKAVLSLFADVEQRIFMDGIAADGSKIGSYSTTPMYVNPATLPKSLPPKGKTGKTKFKNGEPHVTRYFAGGWKDVRNQTGRRIDLVNLDFTGALKSAWVVDFTGKNPVMGFTDDLSGEKADGNEKHFGKVIFDLTQKEIDSFENKIIAAIGEIL